MTTTSPTEARLARTSTGEPLPMNTTADVLVRAAEVTRDIDAHAPKSS